MGGGTMMTLETAAKLTRPIATGPWCVRVCRWNPAPASRRLQGDLFYIEVNTLENHVVHITATSSGFFVNRTHRDTFNPLPQQPLTHAFSLVALLATVSPLFRKNYTQARALVVHG